MPKVSVEVDSIEHWNPLLGPPYTGSNRMWGKFSFLLVVLWVAAADIMAGVLPPLDKVDDEYLSTQSHLNVQEFQFEGNTVFDDFELASVAAPYVGRAISLEELEELRIKLTRYYIDRGYINSGVILHDQPVDDNIIVFTVIEGDLTKINIEGNQRLRPAFIERRLRLKRGRPLNINELQRSLQRLRQGDFIDRVNAELKPGALPGESYLDVHLAETHPFELELIFDNRRTPSVGAERFHLNASARNLSGWGDRLDLGYGITKKGLEEIEFAGLDDVNVAYSIPINRRDTLLSLKYRQSDSSVIEEPFDDFDIESESEEFGFSLNHPVIREIDHEFTLGLTAERREVKTEVLGEPFGPDDGRNRVTVLRFIQEWVKRDLNQVIAVRSSINWGIDVFHPTKIEGSSQDGLFVSWLGQFQYLHRSDKSGSLLVLRTNFQWADDELLSLERFSAGGVDTVRGYRENQLVRDRALTATMEFRIPVVRRKSGHELVWFVPFFDYGWAENVTPTEVEDTNVIASMGAGLVFEPNEHLNCELFWGHDIVDLNSPNNDLQDDGIHFRVSYNFF